MRGRVLLLGLGLLLAACGEGGSSAREVLADTADNLTGINRGEIHLRVTAATLQESDREVGFDVRGPFALAEEEGKLPELRFTYTELSGRESATSTFVSTGDRAYIERDGRTVPVPDDALARFRGKADPEKAAALGRLRVDEWARSPRRTGDRIVSEVDVPKALNDVFGLAASVGAEEAGGFPRVEGKDADALRRAVSSSRLEVVTDAEDRILRSLRLVVDFAPEDRERLEKLLGRFGGARLSVAVDLARTNQSP